MYLIDYLKWAIDNVNNHRNFITQINHKPYKIKTS